MELILINEIVLSGMIHLFCTESFSLDRQFNLSLIKHFCLRAVQKLIVFGWGGESKATSIIFYWTVVILER